MTIFRSILMPMTFAGLLCAPGFAFAQVATPPQQVPLEKTIGVPRTAAKSQIEPSLIVMSADGAALTGDKLTLTGVATNSIVFADRPVRAAGHAPTADVLEEWASGTDSFGKDPPNATVSAFTKDGSGSRDAVVVLKHPDLQGDRLTFDVQVLEGDLTGADGAASVFIDIIGMPLTPGSFAGVARRTTRRAVWYGAATHPYYPSAYYPPPTYYPPPAYPAPRPACGYYPYPPCY